MNFAFKLYLKNIIRLTPTYLKLKYSGKRKNKKNMLANTLLYALKNVPFYKKKYRNSIMNNNIGITKFEYIVKNDLAGNETQFISTKKIKLFLFKFSTGGTTGLSLNLYSDVKSIIYNTYYTDLIFNKISNLKTLKIAVLRGNKPQKGNFTYNHNTLLLSSYDINLQNTRTYISLLKKYNINCIHAYPSSITILCKYINELKNELELPNIKGVITSSETITLQDKQLILDTFSGCTLIDIYGLNEQVALAYSINKEHYTFIKEFSFVEFIKTDLKTESGTIHEIVGTSFFNNAMPLIRYRTEDYAEIDSKGNVISIMGRSQDKIVNIDREISPCIVLTRPKTLNNVISFQYYQDKIGEIEFRIVPSFNFSKLDEEAIIYDINKSFNNKVNVTLKKMEMLPRLENGKQKRLIQKLNFSNFI